MASTRWVGKVLEVRLALSAVFRSSRNDSLKNLEFGLQLLTSNFPAQLHPFTPQRQQHPGFLYCIHPQTTASSPLLSLHIAHLHIYLNNDLHPKHPIHSQWLSLHNDKDKIQWLILTDSGLPTMTYNTPTIHNLINQQWLTPKAPNNPYIAILLYLKASTT